MRRSLGRARALVAIGAIASLVAMALPWVTVGESVLTPTQRNGFDGAGILVFVAAICLLALLLLPYASKTGTSSLDRPVSYVLVAGAGVVGYVIEVVQMFSAGELRLAPDKGPGLWLAGVGLFIVCWGVGELLAERPTTI